MKKLLFLLSLVLLLFTENVFSQSNWVIQCPVPLVTQIGSAYFVDLNTGFFSSPQGNLKTVNTGLTWQFMTNLPVPMTGSYIFSYNKYGKVFTGGEFINSKMSTDYGQNWITLQNVQIYSKVSFINQNTGVAASGTGILKTTDGGYNWLNYPVTITNYFPVDAQMINENLIYEAARYGKVVKSTDGGNSWALLPTGITNDLTRIQFFGANTGYISCWGGDVYKTTNGGENWQKILDLLSSTSHINFFDVNRGAYVNDKGYVYTTTNGGINWSGKHLDSLALLGDIQFLNNNTFILLAAWGWDYAPYFLRTTDFGNSFTFLNNSSRCDHFGLQFLNKNTGYVVGENSKVLKTTNSGVNWLPAMPNYLTGSGHLYYSVFFINANTGFTAGVSGHIAKTTNGGASWTHNTVGSNELKSIYFADANTGYCTGKNGALYKTTNSGVNWISLNTGVTQNYFTVCMLNNTTGFVAGENGRILKTTDAGTSWIAKNTSANYWITSLSFCNANTGLAVGSGGTIIKTTNGGENWTPQVSGTAEQIFSVSMYNTSKAIASGMKGIILETGNGGTSWRLKTIDTSFQLRCIQFTDSNTGFVCGTSNFNGIIASGTELNTIGVQLTGNWIPSEFKLYPNYPNPFNPTTSIKYQVASIKYIKLIVYDILGKEIATLVNEKQSPGVYEVQFPNVQSANVQLTSGIYFYKMIAGDFSEVKRMVLIK